ncbi:MAG: zinc ribbon domain-containing protein [Eubacterium sp.]|jgi:hypothetical protein
MFFLMGITPGRKDFDFYQNMQCGQCGSWGRCQVFMTYMVLSLFFLPCFRWNRHYYVQMSCCGTIYELDREVGRRIARGEDVTIQDRDLTLVQSGGGRSAWGQMKVCPYCGFQTGEDYDYCPKCGSRLSGR